jgi:hypothetical protein
MQQGYLVFEGIECVYVKLTDSMIVTPKNESDISEMYRHCTKTNFILEYEQFIYKKSFSYIEKILPRIDHSFSFVTKYTFNLIDDYEINGFVLTGDDIDVFFSPSRYFYDKKRNKERFCSDILFGKEESSKFYFNYNDKIISVSLYYGEILKHGIASDLKLHPHLSVKFEKTKDFDFVFAVYNIIVKLLQLVRYQKSYNLKPAEIIGVTDKCEKSILGKLYLNPYITKDYKKISESEYVYFESYISQLLQLISDDKYLSIRHLPFNEHESHEYDVHRYLSVFSAFAYECNKQAEEFVYTSDEHLKNIKNDLLMQIELIRKRAFNEQEKIFLDHARERITQLGTQFGQEKKIINAFNNLKNIITGSIQYIFPADFNIKRVSSNLSKLRAKIAHDNLYRELTDEEIRNIRFLDVLSYIMLLKRAGADDSGIELIIGAMFYCNFKYMENTPRNRKTNESI